MEFEDVKKIKFLSSPQAAKFMEISYPTLHRMIKAGKIKPVNVGITGKKRVWGFTPEIIQAYYDSLQNSDTKPKAVNQ